MSGKRRSFGDKLMLLVALTTAVAVILVATAMAIGNLLRMKPAALSSVSTYANVLAVHSTAALSFDDNSAGVETLSALRAVPEVAAAALYDVHGGLFATFIRPDTQIKVPSTPGAVGHVFKRRQLNLTTQVHFDGRTLGNLFLVYDLDGYYREVTGNIKTAAITGIVAIALALLLASQLRRKLARPVVELSSAAQRVSRTQNYSVRAKVFDDDELGNLTNTFNHMLSKIEEYEEKHVQAEQHRRRYTAELERSNRELDEFAYIASHDLRSPLQGIKSLASWIAEDNRELLSEKSQRHIAQMMQRVERLERLLDDLLQYSRAGRANGAIADVSTGQLCRDMVALLAPPEGFKFVIADDMPTINTATVPLEQVFRNLLNNAIKHHDRSEGLIEVSCTPGEEFWTFAVSDDGPGIPPKFHEQIMKMFETLSPRDSVEGSGMGLAVIKKLVEGCGGELKVHSTGRGARFEFSWPRLFPTGATNP